MVSEIYRLARVPAFLYIIIYVIIAALHPRKYRDSLLEKTLTTTATQAVHIIHAVVMHNIIILFITPCPKYRIAIITTAYAST